MDGVSASFELLQQPSKRNQSENGSHPFSSSTDTADACYPRYVAALDAEMSPELLIRPGEAATPLDAGQAPPSLPQAVADVSKDNSSVQPSIPVETKAVEAPATEEVGSILA